MSNPKKRDSGAPEGGRRPTEDAPESSTAAGGRCARRESDSLTCAARQQRGSSDPARCL